MRGKINTCNICGAKCIKLLFHTRDYITGRDFDVFRCSVCGLGYTYPQPSPEKIKEFYPQEYYDDERARLKFLTSPLTRLHYRARIKMILRYVNSRAKNMLDIGCGRGWQLKYFKEKGWNVWGTELSDTAAFFGRNNLGINICVGDIKNCHFENELFDVISVWHVLEHMPDPRSAVEEIYRITKKDGLIFIAVPNFLSWQWGIFKKFWFFLDVPRHLWHFTPESLDDLFVLLQLKVINRSFLSFEYGLLGFTQSLLNLMGSEFNFLWVFITQKAKNVKNLRTDKLILSLSMLIILGPIFFILGVLVESLAVLFNRGSIMTVVVRK